MYWFRWQSGELPEVLEGVPLRSSRPLHDATAILALAAPPVIHRGIVVAVQDIRVRVAGDV
jgi:hypothetical protein